MFFFSESLRRQRGIYVDRIQTFVSLGVGKKLISGCETERWLDKVCQKGDSHKTAIDRSPWQEICPILRVSGAGSFKFDCGNGSMLAAAQCSWRFPHCYWLSSSCSNRRANRLHV